MYYSQTNPPKVGTITAMKDEWIEKDIFGYSKYEVTSIDKNVATIKELKSNHIYTKIKLSELINLKSINN